MNTYTNVQQALPYLLDNVLASGQVYSSRNGGITELLGTSITLTRPWERFHTVKHRNANPFAQIAETFWVLGGRNDVGWLSYYLPRARDFSDDGATWRAGYGPRLVNWPLSSVFGTNAGVNQVQSVLNELREHPDSRRAVISLFNPAIDYAETKDVPCNNWLQFLLRDGTLHMLITVRSNDVMWGWSGINTFEWSVLHEAMARSLGAKIGPVTFFVGSFHLYDEHRERAARIVETARQSYSPYNGLNATEPYWDIRAESMSATCRAFFLGEERLRKNANFITCYQPSARESWFVQVLRTMDLYTRAKKRDISETEMRIRLRLIQAKDMRWAAAEYLSRSWPELGTLDYDTRSIHAPKASDIVVENVLVGIGAVPRIVGSVPTIKVTGLEALKQGAPYAIHKDICSQLLRLQQAKSRTYGDSWKKHGELASIFANISRKYDRLKNLIESGQTVAAETLLDTAADLAVYSALYISWLAPRPVEEVFALAGRNWNNGKLLAAPSRIVDAYADLETWLKVVEPRPLNNPYNNKQMTVWALFEAALDYVRELRSAYPEDWAKLVRYIDDISQEEVQPAG